MFYVFNKNNYSSQPTKMCSNSGSNFYRIDLICLHQCLNIYQTLIIHLYIYVCVIVRMDIYEQYYKQVENICEF